MKYRKTDVYLDLLCFAFTALTAAREFERARTSIRPLDNDEDAADESVHGGHVGLGLGGNGHSWQWQPVQGARRSRTLESGSSADHVVDSVGGRVVFHVVGYMVLMVDLQRLQIIVITCMVVAMQCVVSHEAKRAGASRSYKGLEPPILYAKNLGQHGYAILE